MKRYRFGPDTAIAISDYGSAFRIQPFLASPRAAGGAELAYLAPGDFIARHPAGRPQLFCVLFGSGTVSGDDGEPHTIAAGEAAFWASGEQHETRSEGGLTALILQSDELAPDRWLERIDEG